MCGICAIYNSNGELVDKELLHAMTSTMAHRGPDGSGNHIFDNIGLGHTRLSIIDLDGGVQPMSNEDGTLWITFNGEIYNYIELREELKKMGHVFKTVSDTEVIIHAYKQWGRKCVQYFNGIFAFALLDLSRHKLFLARDHLGVKPLYYVKTKSGYVFASEIKALLRIPGYSSEVDIPALNQLFTFRFVPSPKTLFKGIMKLSPAHTIECSSNGLDVERFWNWRPQINNYRQVPELIEEYRYLMEDAVKLQLRSDVPVGLFLSSGIDSGVLLAIMSEMSTNPIQTFTIGFEDGEKTNETEEAKSLARRYGAHHTELIVSAEDYIEYYNRYMWDIEEPVGNETAAAFYFVSRLASEKVKVTLSGQGADEPWGGYKRHIGVKLSEIYSRLPIFITNEIKRIVDLLPRNARLKRGAVSLAERDVVDRFIKIYSFFSNDMKDQLYRDWLKTEFQKNSSYPKDVLIKFNKEIENLEPLAKMLFIDTRCWLPDDLLMVNDKTSMANSIESRVPFLDYRIIEFIETLPSHLKLKGFQGKYLHKKAIEKWLPKKIVYRKKKGFENPINRWLRTRMNRYVEDLLLDPNAGVAIYFQRDYIRKLIQLHRIGQEQYLRQIYLLLSFEIWYQRFIRT